MPYMTESDRMHGDQDLGQRRRVVFHTGFMKTGSTLLQRSVFPELSDTALYSFDRSPFVPLMKRVRLAGPFDDLDPIVREVQGMIAASTHGLQLFSYEALTGWFLWNHNDFGRMTDVLHDIAPDGHVLLVLRRQDGLLESLYKQVLHTGHANSPEGYCNWRDGEFGHYQSPARANVDVRVYNFDAFYRAYERRFGTGRVHVVAFEWLKTDPDRFRSALEDCLQRPVTIPEGHRSNVGFGPRASAIARHLNPLFRMPHREGGVITYHPFRPWLDRRGGGGALQKTVTAFDNCFDPRRLLQRGMLARPGGHVFDAELREGIMDLHRAGNRALDERLGLGLGKLGYY